ncbi:MAG: ferritin [Bergeyella sp.]|nr:ferritin [Bergeyella sp.]
MNTKRLSTKLEKALSDQMNKEIQASQTFLSYGIWADNAGYSGVANFLWRHSQEEREHSIKFMRFILDRGGKPKVEAIPAPLKDPKNISECFDSVFRHEVDNTTSVYKIVDLALEEKDWATWNFTQWFVQEQVEEEKLARDLIDQLNLAGGEKASHDALFQLDKSLEDQSNDVPSATEASSEHP